MIEQLELGEARHGRDEARPSEQAPVAPSDSRFDRVAKFLFDAGGWVKRREVSEALEIKDRVMRKIIEECDPGVVISSGKGYCHIRHASVEDVLHFKRDMKSRARACLRRMIRVERFYYSLGER
jgi:hypothetical protein